MLLAARIKYLIDNFLAAIFIFFFFFFYLKIILEQNNVPFKAII